MKEKLEIINKKNIDYINQINVEDIPWHSLTTPYARADRFPDFFDKIAKNDVNAIDQLTDLVEHQSTLWHSTPFAILFICRILKIHPVDPDIIIKILHLLISVAEAIKDNLDYGMSTDSHLELFSDMLLEKYLWAEVYDEDEDMMRYEGEPFPPELFCSFYYFSLEILKNYADMFAKLERDSNPAVRDLAVKLNIYVKSLSWQ